MICLWVCLALGAQETPAPNRVAWLAMLPEPLPDGARRLTLEATSQFLRLDRSMNPDTGAMAQLDAEEWQLTGDVAWRIGPLDLCVRLRGVHRSGGFTDQAFLSWHRLLGTPGGGRGAVAKYRIIYHLEKQGQKVAHLDQSRTQLLDTDVALVQICPTSWGGYRWGVSVQLPTGDANTLGGNGALDGLAGGAIWHRRGRWTFHGQAEWMHLGLPADSPYHGVMGNHSLARGWVGAGYQGTGRGAWSGLGLDVTLAFTQSPYRTGLARMDRTGCQQHWTLTHTRLPRWRFGISEEAGTYTAPDLTAFLAFRF